MVMSTPVLCNLVIAYLLNMAVPIQQTLTLPICERVPGRDPPVSPKHIDGCNHEGGFHDSIYELYSSAKLPPGTRAVVPSKTDLTTVLEKDLDNTVDASYASQIIEHSQKKVEELNKYLDGNQVSPSTSRGTQVAAGLRTAPDHNHSTNSHTANIRQATAEPCPGCMYNTTTGLIFDDTKTLAEEDYFGEDAQVQAAGRRR